MVRIQECHKKIYSNFPAKALNKSLCPEGHNYKTTKTDIVLASVISNSQFSRYSDSHPFCKTMQEPNKSVLENNEEQQMEADTK